MTDPTKPDETIIQMVSIIAAAHAVELYAVATKAEKAQLLANARKVITASGQPADTILNDVVAK